MQFEFWSIDILISNAGNATSGLMLELDDKKLRKAFELNFFAHKSFAVEAAKIMKLQKEEGKSYSIYPNKLLTLEVKWVLMVFLKQPLCS